MSNLPLGWEDRGNKFTEKDIKQGADAANKFAVPASAYAGTDGGYQTSDQVRAFYYNQEQETAESSLPPGWGERQRRRDVEAKQHGAFAADTKQPQTPQLPSTQAPNDGGRSERTAESVNTPLAMLKLTTLSLNTLAQVLQEQKTTLPMEERRAFAEAMKHAMNVLAKSA